MRKEIRITGFGGQGVALAGNILGKAAALYAGLEAVMTQAYGPEARGGASSANLVIADEPIDYPFVQAPDILIALSQDAYATFRATAKPDAVVIVDADLVTPLPGDRPLSVPATRIAEELGQRRAANIVMLGYFAAATGILGREALERAIETSLKPKIVPVNLRAFAAGCAYAARVAEGPEKEHPA